MKIEELIHKVLTRQATFQEQEQLNNWIRSDRLHEIEYNEMKMLYEEGAEKYEGDHDARDMAVLDRLRAKVNTHSRQRKTSKQLITVGIGVVISTALLLFAFHGAPGKFFNSDRANDSVSVLLKKTLVFEDATLRQVIDRIKMDYELTIIVADNSILSCRVTGTFSRGVPLEHVVRMLAVSGNISMRKVDTYTLEVSGQGCR